MNNKYLYAALKQYNLQNKTATLIGHNDNMTFNVADLFLLRIHKSSEKFNSDFLYCNAKRADICNTEMKFLQHLKNCGLNVQSPYVNTKGKLVSTLKDGTLATVTSWLDGKSATQEDIDEIFCRQLGSMVSQLHNSSKDFHSENILKYDNPLCDILLSQLYAAQRNGYFDDNHYTILIRAVNIIKNAFSQSINNFTIIHGDLSLSNTLITSSGLALIDFSLFGIGHPMIDIACAYSFITNETMRKTFDKGYISNGGSIDYNMINICYAFNELMGILLHIDKLATEIWFCTWLDDLCRTVFIPVVNGKEPLWTELNG